MNYSKLIFSTLLLSAGVLSVSADKISPDMRIKLDARHKNASAHLSPAQDTYKVFIAFEKGFDVQNLSISGLQIESIFNDVATASVTSPAIEALCQVEEVRYVQLATAVNLLNDWGRRELKVNDVHHNTGSTLPRPYTGKGVIVGVIDTGLEYGHHAFYNSDGTELRIRRVWEQNNYGTPPEGFTYGRELTTPDEMLQATYDTKSQYHGTHTTGTAAGGGDLATKYYGMAPDADIVFVSFNNEDNSCIADGIKYIFDYADQMDMPCVINISLGAHHGPHDGTSYLDQVIDQMTGPGRIIVGACGNEGEARMHVSKNFTESDNTLKTILTYSSAQAHKMHYLDIWGSPGSNLKVSMGIFNSLKGQKVDQSKVFDTSDISGSAIGYFTYLEEQGVDMDALIYGEINPENNSPHVWIQSEVGTSGTGRMPGLIVEGDPGAYVNVWNEGQHEFSSNNKSGFTDGDNKSTVGEIGGTAKRIITVGSFDGRDTLIFCRNQWADMHEIGFYNQYEHSVFSSCGPTADGRTVPHILAPGLPVISALNRYALDTQSLEANYADYTQDKDGRKYYYIYNMGTSMSAPHVTGIVALMLQANPNLTPEEAREIIQSTATTSATMGDLPNNVYGAGRINALSCVQRVVQTSALDEISCDGFSPEATQVWASDGQIHVFTPMRGASLRLYSLTGQLIKQVALDDNATVVDASGLGRQVMIAEVVGATSHRTFKIAL